MADRNSNKQSRNASMRRRRVAIVGGGFSALVAAAAMATGSAAPAKADIDDLLDPIIQPILTQVTDSLAGFDPALATDLTSWTDTLLADLNSLDTTAAAAATATTAAASSASSTGTADSPTSGTYDIPITMAEDTEPTVQATVDGATNTLLVDTGSSGLVLPWQDLGSNDFQALENLFDLGFPTAVHSSGYSGGVEYIYLEYNNVPTDYLSNGTDVLDTSGPVDVEVLSWPTSLSSPLSFQDFLNDDGVTGILGIGADTAGPTTSPLEADGYDGVTVDVPQGELIVSPTNAGTAIAGDSTVSGAPVTSDALTETVTDGSTTVGTGSVYDDVDSGGVYGTIPSSIDSSTVAQGDTVSVYNDGTLLYSYNVGTDSDDTDEAPEVVSGVGTASNPIDSGVEPFEEEPIYIDYTDDTMTFDTPAP
jgi:hypothetical protein